MKNSTVKTTTVAVAAVALSISASVNAGTSTETLRTINETTVVNQATISSVALGNVDNVTFETNLSEDEYQFNQLVTTRDPILDPGQKKWKKIRALIFGPELPQPEEKPAEEKPANG